MGLRPRRAGTAGTAALVVGCPPVPPPPPTVPVDTRSAARGDAMYFEVNSPNIPTSRRIRRVRSRPEVTSPAVARVRPSSALRISARRRRPPREPSTVSWSASGWRRSRCRSHACRSTWRPASRPSRRRRRTEPTTGSPPERGEVLAGEGPNGRAADHPGAQPAADLGRRRHGRPPGRRHGDRVGERGRLRDGSPGDRPGSHEGEPSRSGYRKAGDLGETSSAGSP